MLDKRLAVAESQFGAPAHVFDMSSYVANADNEAEELRDSLSEDDIEHLRADLEQLGFDAWLDWAEKNRDEANDYLRATPKQRERKKKWQEPALRRRLILC